MRGWSSGRIAVKVVARDVVGLRFDVLLSVKLGHVQRNRLSNLFLLTVVAQDVEVKDDKDAGTS